MNASGESQTMKMPQGGFRWCHDHEALMIKRFYEHRNENVSKGVVLDWNELFPENEGFYIGIAI